MASRRATRSDATSSKRPIGDLRVINLEKYDNGEGQPYSPDLNPIEQVFAKLKAILRKRGARTVDDLWAAIADALDEFSATECGNYLVNAGYSV